MTAKLTELRREQRFRSTYPVFLGNTLCATRDISASGVYFWKDGMCMYAPGDSIHFSIELDTPKGRLMWKCQGTVVRAEPIGRMAGVAVRMTDVKMEPLYAGAARKETELSY